MARKETRAVRNALLKVAADIEAEGAGADKLKAFASLLNAYLRMERPEGKERGSTNEKNELDYFVTGDPRHHTRLMQSGRR